MVRVAFVPREIEAGITRPLPDGLTAAEVLSASLRGHGQMRASGIATGIIFLSPCGPQALRL